MRRSGPELAALFGAGISLAAAACAATTDAVDGSIPPVGSTSATPVASASSAPSATPSATAVATAVATIERPKPPPHDDSTPEGYAAGFQSIGPYALALSGLELLGFGDVVEGKLVWNGEPCPAEWNVVVDGSFTRAAIVKKSRTLAVITPANFFQWVGPVDTPEKAALRAQLEDGRTLATCGKVKEQGFACAVGSDERAVAVREVDGGFEVATYDLRPVCGGSRWGGGVALGSSRVGPQGETSESRNVLTDKTYADARPTAECHYPVRGRAYEGFVDDPPEASDAEYYARAANHEAAAAVAFERLAAELTTHGAPEDLVADARAAADDERRHAALFAACGGLAPATPPACVPWTRRSLVDVLVENAREGCANETYAAVIATYQATHAPTSRLRALLGAIAPDEQRHAALSHRVHAWGVSVSSAAARARVERERLRAIDAIATAGAATETAERLGEPPPALARAAFRHVVSAL